jgi:hypothetical protein
MKILLRNYDIAIKECVVPLTHEILHFRLEIYIDNPYKWLKISNSSKNKPYYINY